ncbi:MAG TPA: DUF6796 family protein [Microlunatus sp.]|nr:DUF6796 family protein [Microlunatus sp.]
MKPGRGVLGRRTAALLGLAGAVLSGVGDVLILGRPGSGREFDEATGRIPPHIDVDPRWRSLWNGASFAPGRLHAGTLIGVAGIGALQWAGLHAAARAVPPGRLRRLATVSAAGFAVSGVLTHLGCGAVILAYGRAVDADATDGRQASPRSATTMLAVSALGALGALALFSGAVIGAAARRPDTMPRGRAIVAPFPCVLATLATFGMLPAPIGGYLRPASMSIGLALYFAVGAATTQEIAEAASSSR